MEHLDVVIIGAGLSGIGAAWHLQQRCPGKHYAILESREAIGGTWDLFRYPGVRSDSDMFTLGYHFKPWHGEKSITDGASIRDYIVETAHENGIDQHIRFGNRLIAADWSSVDACWTLTIAHGGDRGGEDDVEHTQITAQFLFMASGYYRYDAGYTPKFAGIDDFGGRIVHPQLWPEALDYADKQVVVIGSGATAMTLVPSMAVTAAKVTLLQRSPTYVADVPARDIAADRLRKWLPAKLAYSVVRAKKVIGSMIQFGAMRRYPEKARTQLIDLVKQGVGSDYDVATHFTPRYMPWDQRLCAVPDGDLFAAIRDGRVEMVTDTIARFDPQGIVLDSGARIDADIVVTATGLRMQLMGGATLSVDGRVIRPADTMLYKGMMLGDVPNLFTIIGYNNASWTLKADLSSDHACRIIARVERRGSASAVARLDRSSMTDANFFGLTSGYLARALDQVPKQGSKHPWRVHHNYARDYAALKFGRIDDGVLEFFARPAARTAA